MSTAHIATISGGRWTNTIKSHSVQAKKIFCPKTSEEISAIVKEAETLGVTVRVVGSGHSFSSVALGSESGYIVDLQKISFVEQYPTGYRYGPSIKKNLLHVGAGITIADLNRKLTARNFSIPTMGGIDHQTLAGAISTGTHGSGSNVKAMHGMVRAVQLIRGGGERIHLEPEFGVSKKELAKYGDFAVRRNTEEFEAALVSLGGMGIIYAYIIELEPLYWLRESKTRMLWSDLKPRLRDQSLFKHDRSVMVQINPYKGVSKDDPNDYSCLVITQKYRSSRPMRPLSDRMRNLIGNIASNFPVIRFVIYLLFLFKARRMITLLPKMLESSLRWQADMGFVHKAHKVMHQGAEFIKERAYDCEVAFDLSQDDYIDTVEQLLKNAQEMQTHNCYHTSPIGLRFVDKSNALLAPDYQRKVVYIDTPMLLKSHHHEEVIDACLKIMVEAKGMPHWGKHSGSYYATRKGVQAIVSTWNRWVAIRTQYDPENCFVGPFLQPLVK